MKKELLLFAASGLFTLLAAIGLMRWLAPQLLGIPLDLQLVQVDDKIPPFFEGVFRDADIRGKEYIIRDPYIMRAKPLLPRLPTMGPNDLLGFRNTAVPAVADIVTIGDSQTYGNNVHLEKNWPSQLAARLEDYAPNLYNMSVGGWGAIEYGEIFNKALYLRPHVIVVAFYAGNDPLDSFMRVYGDARWERLRPDSTLTADDAPSASFPPPEKEWWAVTFADGTKTVFTPSLRLLSNRDHPTVRAGYAIMAEIGRRMGAVARQAGIGLVFTIIPTKELAYERKVRRDGLRAPQDYLDLVSREKTYADSLAATLGRIPGAHYVDVIEGLQEAALTDPSLYPHNINGHPLAPGYAVIAGKMAGVIRGALPYRPEGAIAIETAEGEYFVYLVRDRRMWTFDSSETFVGNGWSPDAIPTVRQRDIDTIPFAGVIDRIEPERFGPESFRP